MNRNLRLRVLPQIPPVDGKEIELGTSATHIQWRYINPPFPPGDWVDLYPLASLVGPEGPSIELRSDGTNIQYRVVGEATWVNVVPLDDLRGPQGIQGEQGIQGIGVPTIGPGDAGKLLAVKGTEDGTEWVTPSSAKPFPQGRLSLTSGVAFPASPVAGATTIYYEPVLGTAISIYDGATFAVKDLAGAIALALDSNSGHTGYQQADRNFDLFVFDDGGTIRLATGPTWNAGAVAGSDTARGTGAGSTELETFGGLLVNKNTITLRWGSASGNTASVPVRRATYVGSFRATANGQASDTPTKRVLFSGYNQAARKLFVSDPVESYNYTSATYRQFNGNAANKVEFLLGLAGILVSALAQCYVSSSDGTARLSTVSIGVDATTSTPSDDVVPGSLAAVAAAQTTFARYLGYPGIGFHYLAPLESGSPSATNQRWFGNNAGTYPVRPGLSGEVVL